MTTAFLPFLTLSEVFSTGSADLSTEVDACDLLSHVDSDDALGKEDTSSSLVTVDEDEAPRSGDDTLEPSTERDTGLAGFEDDRCGRDSWDVAEVVGRGSVSSSSAQFFTELRGAGPSVVTASLAGVAEPDTGLFAATGVAMPFAACAYEKVVAIAMVGRSSQPSSTGEAGLLVIPDGKAAMSWPARVLEVMCPERYSMTSPHG